METQRMNIWGKEFRLKVDYDCFGGEEVYSYQTDRVKWLTANPRIVDGVLGEMTSYIAQDEFSDGVRVNAGNICQYVRPEMIFVPQTEEADVVVLLCDYEFDPEHGLAIVFEDGKLKEIGPQDIIL